MASKPSAADLQIITRIAVFRGLKPETVEHIIAPATVALVQPQECIFHQGDPATAFFLVTKGRVEVLASSGRKKATKVKELGRGSFFGEMALIDGARRGATVKALTDTECLVLPRRAFLAELRANPRIAVSMLPALSMQAREDARDARPVVELLRYI